MTSNNNIFEQVGAYLDNELTGEDLARFDEELARNPELKKEVDFQKETIDGIKSYRHAQLKARLDNIPLGGGFMTGTLVKIISGVVIVTGIGYGVYELAGNKEEINTPVEEVAPVENQTSANKPEVGIQEEQVVSQEEETIEENTQQEVGTEPISNEPEVTEEETIVPITTPDIPEPESFEMEEQVEDDLELPENSLGTEEEPLESQLEIEIISNKRKYPFHYQVTDGRLFLYGNFDDEPYELLEINVNKEKKLYLYFKDKYYEIAEDASEITPLNGVTNSSLISELEKVRNKDF